MAIFNFLYKLFRTLGFLVLLFVFSYVITSVTYYSIKTDSTNEETILNIHSDKLHCIDIYNKEYIAINVKTKKEVTNEYMVAYAFSYFEMYDKEVHIYVVDKDYIVIVGKEERGVVTSAKYN